MFGFWKNTNGNVAIIAGLSLLPITVLAGSAIDMANVVTDRSRIQHALDIAALDTARRISADPAFASNDADVLDFAVSSFHSNYFASTRSGARITETDGSVTIDITNGISRSAGVVREITLTADADHKANFMHMMMEGDVIESTTVSAAVVRNDTFDVVMVLDNSGSMSGTRINTLRTAATDLTNILMAMNESGGVTDRIKMGLVPFSTYVNVGASNINATWLDQNAQSPIHSENFDQAANRFDLFDQINGVSWQGCVESRPHPHDVNDVTPATGTPATLFVPVFAPDEPDGNNDNGMTYYNNYLDDEGGTCPGRAPSGSDRPLVSQARICKYTNATPSSSVQTNNGISTGPNYNCRSQPIQPLTTTKSTIVGAISSMQAAGYTNIHQGVVWGWRALSKAAPFTESRDDDKDDHYKILIMMTDGDNYYGYTSNNHNKSRYGAYGFAALNRIEASPLSSSGWLSKSNERTAEACANAKSSGNVLIYSIAFKLNNQTTVNMMRNCATRTDMFFASDSNAELRAAFEEIAQSISKLRLSQ